MQTWNGSIRTQHIDGEALLIDLGRSAILSDHPHRFGGSDKGPMPGDLMKGALASSAALALGAAADRGELPISAIAVRCSSTLAYEDVDGPLQTLIYVPDFVLNVAVTGELDDSQIAAASRIVLGTRIARALAADLDVDETNVFISGDAARRPVGAMAILAETRGSIDPGRTPDQQSPAGATVEYIGNGRALISWANTSCVVTADGVEAAGSVGDPEGLLLASLAACTTVYTSRAAAKSGAKVDLTVFCEGSLGGDGNRSGRITKRLEIGGNVSPEQREAIAFSSDHCALGETLRRSARLSVNIHCSSGGAGSASALGTTQERMAQIAAADCDDGACCVPQTGA